MARYYFLGCKYREVEEMFLPFHLLVHDVYTLKKKIEDDNKAYILLSLSLNVYTSSLPHGVFCESKVVVNDK